MAVETNRKIIVVDDEPDAVKLAAESIALDGWQALVAANGAEAFDIIQREKPWFLIVGEELGDMAGHTLLLRLLGELSRGDLPQILMLTRPYSGGGFGRWSEFGEAARLPEIMLHKPFNALELRYFVNLLHGIAATDLQAGYDRVAEEYTQRLGNELDKKPFDRDILARLAEKVGNGLICDLGCGPGQIAGYLHDLGASVCGVDLSPEMVHQAKRLHPAIPFQVGNMLLLEGVTDNSFAAIAAFYSIIHVPRSLVERALREMWRVLRPQGTLLLTFHLGQETRHLDEWWGKTVSLDFHFFETAEITRLLKRQGFALEEAIERDPYPDGEVQTRRAYLFARKG